jgi:O-succinylhomoserine sulfhydrylase
MSEENYQLETLAVRAGRVQSQFHEHSEAMFLTSSFTFDSAEQALYRRRAGQYLCALHQSHGHHV